MSLHISKKGEPVRCPAKKRCRLRPAEEHFETREEALSFIESSESMLPKAEPLVRRKRAAITMVGATLLTTVTLAGCGNIPQMGEDRPAPEQTQSAPQEAEPDESQESEQPESESDPGAGEKLKERAKSAWSEAKDLADSPSEESPREAISGVTWQGEELEPSASEVDDAKSTLESIPISEELSGDSYDRDSYGSYDRIAGDIEQRDYPGLEFNEDGRASGGDFIDPYTGKTVTIVPGSSSDSDVEHVVALQEAERSQRYEGQLTPGEKESIATDFDNLAIVSSSANRSKGSKDAGEWLPTYEPTQCTYVVTQIKVKEKYKLTVDSNEYESMRDVLENRCEA